jgi:hypothetical protein
LLSAVEIDLRTDDDAYRGPRLFTTTVFVDPNVLVCARDPAH